MQQPAPAPAWANPSVVARVVLIVLAVLAAVGVLYLLRQPLGWLFLATFLAVAVSGPVAWFSKYMPRGLAIAVTYLLLFLVPVGIMLAIIPAAVHGIDGLIEEAPNFAADAQRYVQENDLFSGLESDYHVLSNLKEQAANLPAKMGDVAGWLGTFGLGVVNSGFATINIILLSIFILAGGPRWSRAWLAKRPAAQQERLERVFSGIGATVGNYVMGALGQALVAAITTYVVLLILGVPFAAGLAAITFVLDLIPLVGATLAAIIVGIFTLFVGFPTTTIIWVIFAIAYQQLENNVIQPQIQRRAVAIEPIVVLLSVLCGATLAGILGAVLAIPVAASVQLVIREWRAYSAELAGLPSGAGTSAGSDAGSGLSSGDDDAAPDDAAPSATA